MITNKPNLPNILYKYRDISNPNHLEILENQTIFLSSAYKFNDPFDCKIPLNYHSVAKNEDLQRKFARKMCEMHLENKDEIEKYVEKFVSKGLLKDKEFLRQYAEEDVKKLHDTFGIYCLSQEPNNILLWSHYGNCHSGVCIGFNSTKLHNFLKFDGVAPVTYFSLYPNMSVLLDNKQLLYNQLYNKSIHWSYEKEFRYVKIGTVNTKLKFPAEVIEEIYLGCLVTKENELLIKEIRNRKFSNAKIFRFKKSSISYSLEKEEI